MQKIILAKEQIYEIVSANRYRVEKEKRFLSRCIDGRYPTSSRQNVGTSLGAGQNIQLPALAFPGGDVGELALLFATANAYGFEIDAQKALTALTEVIGDEKNFGMHTDHHGNKTKTASGCGHWKQINLDPDAYQLEKDQLVTIQKQLDRLKKVGANEIILEGEHLEGAVLLVRGSPRGEAGDWGVLPRYKLQLEGGVNEAQVFIYHQTLVDERHRLLAKKLIDNKAVRLYEGCDEEYLYQVLSEMAENHLMETVRRLATGLPIYSIKFEGGGDFQIKEMGKV